MKCADLTQERLRELLSYDPDTGEFRWRSNGTGRSRAGQLAGFKDRDGYRVYIGGRRHYSHRLAWLYVSGAWPSYYIDHIDGNPFNNAALRSKRTKVRAAEMVGGSNHGG